MPLRVEKSKGQKRQERSQLSSEIRAEMRKGKFAREAVKSVLAKKKK